LQNTIGTQNKKKYIEVRDSAKCSTNTNKILIKQLSKERSVQAIDELGEHGLDPADPLLSDELTSNEYAL
jgi:hypothetical protein